MTTQKPRQIVFTFVCPPRCLNRLTVDSNGRLRVEHGGHYCLTVKTFNYCIIFGVDGY